MALLGYNTFRYVCCTWTETDTGPGMGTRNRQRHKIQETGIDVALRRKLIRGRAWVRGIVNVIKFKKRELVAQFQNASTEESKEKIVANLANFAYDPYNYTFLRQLNVLELFLDCITEPNEKLIEFGAGGICNSCVDPVNAAVIIKCDGIPLLIQCLSSPVKNTVNYALGALYYLCKASTKEAILRPEVIDIIKRYAAAGAVNVSFSNLARSFLDKHVSENH